MTRRLALAAALLVLGAATAPAGAEEGPRWAERIAAARKADPDGLVLALPAAAGEAPSPCVRVERSSRLATFLDHLARAEPHPVLLGPNPAVEVGRLTLLAGRDVLVVVSVTAHGLRVADGPGAALAFTSPALLRWAADELAAPDRRLLPPTTAALLAPRIEALAKATAAWAKADAPRTDLVRNGSFEQALPGHESPLGWDRMDGLTSFRVLDAVDPKAHGRVLLLDTDVYEAEWKRRQDEMKSNPDAPAWPKTPVPERDQYATVGGNHGVSVYSDPIPVEPGRPYRLALAYRTELASGVAKVWVRGYGSLATPTGPEERRLFDALSTLRMGSPGWKTHSFVFHPTKSTPLVATMRVMLYGYWPRGRYAFDDVSIVPISDDEYARAKATERADVK